MTASCTRANGQAARGRRRRGNGAATYVPNGDVLFLTVSITGKVNLFGWLQAKLDDDIDLVPEEQYTGGKSRDQLRQEGAVEIADSKQAAEYVAATRLGIPVT